MLAQTVLPFNLNVAKDTIAPHAGLALFGEFLHALTLPCLLDEALPGPGSGAGRHRRDPPRFPGRGGPTPPHGDLVIARTAGPPCPENP
jgi:hypothetical protein